MSHTAYEQTLTFLPANLRTRNSRLLIRVKLNDALTNNAEHGDNKMGYRGMTYAPVQKDTAFRNATPFPPMMTRPARRGT